MESPPAIPATSGGRGDLHIPPRAGEDRLTAELRALAMRPPAARLRSLRARRPETLDAMDDHWPAFAHGGQLPPDGEWRTWLLMAGRGFGKTRAGAEWISGQARRDGALRIALVGATEDEARAIMVEGVSGLVNVGPPEARPRWVRGQGRLIWPSGAEAFTYSGVSPEALRGPEHHLAWCDELGKWARAEAAWANLMLGLRLGPRPRALVTTTPRPTPLLRRLAGDPKVAMTRGRMAENIALSEGFADEMRAMWGETRFARQELDGELIEDAEGSLWPRELIEACRVEGPPPPSTALSTMLRTVGTFGGFAPPGNPGGEPFSRVVVGVDPPASASGDACGIVVVAKGRDDPSTGSGQAVGYVLEDATVAGRSPEGWARAVAGAAARWDADRVVAEVNQGGDMVESVLRGASVNLPIRKVHAARAKVARAEPVAALYEKGRMKHAGCFPELEDQLAGFCTGGYAGPGRSPDRADALIWAASELLLGGTQLQPRVFQF